MRFVRRVVDKLYSETNLAYLAGFTDGEGTVRVSVASHRGESQYTAQFSVYNTSKPVLEWIEETFDGHILDVRDEDSERNLRAAWAVTWDYYQMQNILPQLLPYLHVKHRQAELVIEFLTKCGELPNKSRGVIADELVFECSKLNAKGVCHSACT